MIFHETLCSEVLETVITWDYATYTDLQPCTNFLSAAHEMIISLEQQYCNVLLISHSSYLGTDPQCKWVSSNLFQIHLGRNPSFQKSEHRPGRCKVKDELKYLDAYRREGYINTPSP